MKSVVIRGWLIMLALMIIVARLFSVQHDDLLLSHVAGRQISFEGSILDDPAVQNGSSRFLLGVKKINEEKVSGAHNILVKSDSGDFQYGGEVMFVADIKRPEKIDNQDGRSFDYPAYLSKDHIFYMANVRNGAKVLSRGGGNPIVSALYSFKHSFVDHINKILPSPHAFLASGLIISGKGSLSKELQTDFQRVGLIHIVVLSGFNISVIGEAITRIFSFLPATLGAICGGAGIILFSIMTGGGSTVVRSAIMSLIGLYARVSGRTNSALTSLLVAGTLMLMWNPLLALYDPSFQLSFAATLGLILYAEPIERVLTPIAKRLHFSKELLSLISSTVATQIFTMPLIMRLSGVISLIALPVNVIVLPFIPFTMFFVFVAGVASFMNSMLAILPAFVSWMLLTYELWVVKHAAGFSFAAITLPPVTLPTIFISYSVLLYIGIVAYHKGLLRKAKAESEFFKSNNLPPEAYTYISNTPITDRVQREVRPP